jgi:cystathionine beta-lyase
MLDPALTELDLDELRQRSSAKWSEYPDDVLPSWVAEMDFPLAPPIAAALADAIAKGDAGYANPDRSRLGAALADFSRRRFGWEIDPDMVGACHDVVGGLRDVLRVLCEPGAEVIVCPPVYHPFFSLVVEAGCRVREVPLRPGGDLDLEGVDSALAGGAEAILLCNPQNPVGTVCSREELAALADLAVAHDAWVLADEIHAPLILPGAEHVPFLTVSDVARERGLAFVSASKAFNVAGLGCAQIVAASKAGWRVVEELPFGARHPSQFGLIAAIAAYSSAEAEEWLDAVIEVLDRNRALLAELLEERLPEANYVPPRAGYLCWIDLSALGLGDDPAPILLERGRIALSPGVQFGNGGEGHVRLNAGTSPDLVKEAVERIVTGASKEDS